MALVDRRNGRNFGYGRQLSYAGPQALKDMFGCGHYGTVKAHSDRWLAFVKWCRSEEGPGVNDARKIDREVLSDYAIYLRGRVEHGDLAISTAQNRLSSVNRTIAALRGDHQVKLPSPSKALGMQRTGVRHSIPQGQDREQVNQIVYLLCSQDQLRAAAIVLLARATGMRLREAILADLPRLSREAKDLGKINIQDGTKGGRAGASAPRWIMADDRIRDAIQFAWHASPTGSRNLIAATESYSNVLHKIVRPARDILHAHHLKGFHELRAAFACERYEQITRSQAPVHGGKYCKTDRRTDFEARRQISYELGHGRVDVVAAYIGGQHEHAI
ncbi:integrase domain-containing protein [Pseudomonas syringae]|uniref:integrase domain-containing protein n=1 Tax=Pseudomonas syringae TaxID=317 RepID=UPI001F331B14|nr:integrase domain-containing protein [Pseudomonas syringae]MBL3835402.1 integrase [Pseudomonas syringae pv. theae]MBL3865907.1 integrase [Pseudomonas syringae pv. theae]GKQ48202.1 integrase domain-containing protein [Pseudomonas syringae pv. theae]